MYIDYLAPYVFVFIHFIYFFDLICNDTDSNRKETVQVLNNYMITYHIFLQTTPSAYFCMYGYQCTISSATSDFTPNFI